MGFFFYPLQMNILKLKDLIFAINTFTKEVDFHLFPDQRGEAADSCVYISARSASEASSDTASDYKTTTQPSNWEHESEGSQILFQQQSPWFECLQRCYPVTPQHFSFCLSAQAGLMCSDPLTETSEPIQCSYYVQPNGFHLTGKTARFFLSKMDQKFPTRFNRGVETKLLMGIPAMRL